MNTFIIADIHGRFTELQEPLDNAVITDDLVIALGDIVDRGHTNIDFRRISWYFSCVIYLRMTGIYMC